MIAPARRAALQCLLAVSSGDADLASALEPIRSRLTDPRDRALATDIVTGVQRWRGLLDHLIVTLAKRPLTRIDAEIVEVLRLSIYQLLYLTRVPAAAVVDDAVNLAGQAGKKSAGGFVNAVLRTVSRQRHALPLPARPADTDNRDAALDYLTIALSHPRWLVERWLDRVGFADTERWLQFNNATPPLTIRANRFRTTAAQLHATLTAHGIAATRGRHAPDCFDVDRGGRTPTDELESLHQSFVVQDEASQLVTLLAGEFPGHLVLDTCASPGGKTTALAAAQRAGLGERGGAPRPAAIIACDVRARRVDLLRRTLTLTGAVGVQVVQADLLQPLPFQPRFDCVFVDAPCSGLGTVRRDPDIKWRRRADDVTALAERQGQMLVHAAQMVAPGGRLIYATCSSEPEENDGVVRTFAAASGFTIVDARSVHPVFAADPHQLIDSGGMLRTLPYRHQVEAFFGAVLQRGAEPPVGAGEL
jgi:16S rRNA (cytosine967-C5)-methyltransferase